MSAKESVVALFRTHVEAEGAIKELQRAGFDMQKLSIVGKDYHTEENVVGYYNAGSRMAYWGKLGAFWGGLWGFLFGAAFFWVPGIGPLVVGGPLVSWIVGALEGDLNLVGCVGNTSECPRTSICVTRDLWNDLGATIAQRLDAMTLHDLVRQYRKKKESVATYSI